MKTLNWIFTFSSINLLLVTIERFSPTTKILLQPYNFLRLHELLQMTTLILLTVIFPIFILKEVTNNFSAIKNNYGFILLLTFITGVYFYATGNGLHEVSSFNFNNFCDTKNITNDACGSFFFNDYYTGNILYFIGASIMIISLMLFEKNNSDVSFNKKDMWILVINSAIYSLAIFAYAAFDKVNVGFVLESLSMDLLRVALGLHRGSYKMAERFSEEVLKRKSEINEKEIKPYLQVALSKMETSLKLSDFDKKAEDSLMYSIIIRNYCQTFLHN